MSRSRYPRPPSTAQGEEGAGRPFQPPPVRAGAPLSSLGAGRGQAAADSSLPLPREARARWRRSAAGRGSARGGGLPAGGAGVGEPGSAPPPAAPPPASPSPPGCPAAAAAAPAPKFPVTRVGQLPPAPALRALGTWGSGARQGLSAPSLPPPPPAARRPSPAPKELLHEGSWAAGRAAAAAAQNRPGSRGFMPRG